MQLSELERRKAAAVSREDYDAAKTIKDKLHALRTAAGVPLRPPPSVPPPPPLTGAAAARAAVAELGPADLHDQVEPPTPPPRARSWSPLLTSPACPPSEQVALQQRAQAEARISKLAQQALEPPPPPRQPTPQRGPPPPPTPPGMHGGMQGEQHLERPVPRSRGPGDERPAGPRTPQADAQAAAYQNLADERPLPRAPPPGGSPQPESPPKSNSFRGTGGSPGSLGGGGAAG